MSNQVEPNLQLYVEQLKSIDPSAKMVKDVLKCQYNNHAVTVSKPSDDSLLVTLKAPAHMKYSVNSNVVNILLSKSVFSIT